MGDIRKEMVEKSIIVIKRTMEKNEKSVNVMFQFLKIKGISEKEIKMACKCLLDPTTLVDGPPTLMDETDAIEAFLRLEAERLSGEAEKGYSATLLGRGSGRRGIKTDRQFDKKVTLLLKSGEEGHVFQYQKKKEKLADAYLATLNQLKEHGEMADQVERYQKLYNKAAGLDEEGKPKFEEILLLDSQVFLCGPSVTIVFDGHAPTDAFKNEDGKPELTFVFPTREEAGSFHGYCESKSL